MHYLGEITRESLRALTESELEFGGARKQRGVLMAGAVVTCRRMHSWACVTAVFAVFAVSLP